jgi:hypothetical protein
MHLRIYSLPPRTPFLAAAKSSRAGPVSNVICLVVVAVCTILKGVGA